jgi:uncharacterized membrane protein YecN with MAPEG domain
MLITSLYAGLLALVFLALSVRVVQKRTGRSGVSLGDGGDAELMRRIRGHANFAEYVPILLIMLAALEYGGALPGWLLHLLGITMVVARVLHGVALAYTQKWVFGRFYGAALTFLLLLVMALLCVWRGLAALLI